MRTLRLVLTECGSALPPSEHTIDSGGLAIATFRAPAYHRVRGLLHRPAGTCQRDHPRRQASAEPSGRTLRVFDGLHEVKRPDDTLIKTRAGPPRQRNATASTTSARRSATLTPRLKLVRDGRCAHELAQRTFLANHIGQVVAADS
jgi:hypothetical protein